MPCWPRATGRSWWRATTTSPSRTCGRHVLPSPATATPSAPGRERRATGRWWWTAIRNDDAAWYYPSPEEAAEPRSPIGWRSGRAWPSKRLASAGHPGQAGPLTGHVEAGDGSGGGDVEGRKRAVLGDGCQHVAPLSGQRGQAGPLRAEDQGHRLIAQRQLVERLARPPRPDRPSTPPWPTDAGRAAGMPATRAMGRYSTAPGRHLGHRGGEVGRPVAREHDAGDPGALGAPQQGPEVVRIGDAVQHQQERHPTSAGRLAQ